MARKKSINDLVSQANRIAERGTPSRIRRAEAALRSYRRNIQSARGERFWRGDIWKETNRKYSRSTYMGLANG